MRVCPTDMNVSAANSAMLKACWGSIGRHQVGDLSVLAIAVCWRSQVRLARVPSLSLFSSLSGMLEEEVPTFVTQMFGALVESDIFQDNEPPNHVLINSYRSGQGIAPHQDGPLYRPLVAILSLNGPALLQFWAPRQDHDGAALAPDLNATSHDPSTSVLCQPNSLLVFRSDAYETHWHGIESLHEDVLAAHTGNTAALSGSLQGANAGAAVPRGERRVSLTVRRVLKIKDAEDRIFTEDAMAEGQRKDKWWLASRCEEGLSRGFH